MSKSNLLGICWIGVDGETIDVFALILQRAVELKLVIGDNLGLTIVLVDEDTVV